MLGSRSQLNKSLRACDIQQTLSKLVPIRENRFIGEVNRQIATSPKMLELSDDERKAVFQKLKDEPFKDVDLAQCRTPEDLSAAAERRIGAAIDKLRKESDAGLHENMLGARKSVETAAGAKEPTGLRDLNTVLKEATVYKPIPYPKPGPDPRPLMTVDQLPEQIDFEVDGLVYKFPKIHHMPEDEEERAWITDVLDYMFAPLEKNYGDMKGGDIGNRIRNEIMINAKDLA